jgi:acyl carrier protein
MERAAILTKLVEILTRSVGQTIGAVSESTSLKDELKLDSIDLVATALEVQSDFNVEIKNEDFAGIVLVKDLIDLIQRKLPPGQRQAA